MPAANFLSDPLITAKRTGTDEVDIIENIAAVKTLNTPVVSLAQTEALAEQLEPIARKIEFLQSTAILQIASEAAKIHEVLRYRRDDGGYTGYMKKRLGYSSSSAYRLLDVHTVFGDGESFPNWETLPVTALYQLSDRSTPKAARDVVAERIEAGEKLSCATVTEIITKAKNIGVGAVSMPEVSNFANMAEDDKIVL
jgi:hypothetical protein